MAPHDSLEPSYFDGVYAAAADPWCFETSAYEQAKYAATVAALGQRQFGRGFEIGCSVGVLTALLAQRCQHLLAVDVSDAALQSARRRLQHLPHVQLENWQLPQQCPPGPFDLVVLSEVGYYWSLHDLGLASSCITAALQPGGLLLLVHWTPVVADYPLTGDTVHAHFLDLAADSGPLTHLHGQRADRYRLDLFERKPEAPAPANSSA